MGFGYRSTVIPEDWLFVDAVLEGHPEATSEISRRMDEIKATREESQPVRTPTGGSTFANPAGAKAWELIDAAGCRGLVCGGAMVSEKHCNFLINTGEATAADLEGLGEEVRRRVFETSGITLEWEIRRIGIPLHGLVEESGI
jgi:UDP-N-acetylmuramate dehydrogenase